MSMVISPANPLFCSSPQKFHDPSVKPTTKEEFIHKQVEDVLEQYAKWLEEKEEHEKTKRKRG
jgi:hypothetical protein